MNHMYMQPRSRSADGWCMQCLHAIALQAAFLLFAVCMQLRTKVSFVLVDPAVSKKPIIVGASVGSTCGLAMVILLGLSVRWLQRRQRAPIGKFSQTALLKLSLSSGNAFKFELDKAGWPVLLGEGGFGEV